VDGTFLDAASYYLLPFIYGEGGDIIDASAKKITVNDATALKAVAIAQDLVKSGAAVTDVTKDATPTCRPPSRTAGAMVVNGPWSTADRPEGLGVHQRRQPRHRHGPGRLGQGRRPGRRPQPGVYAVRRTWTPPTCSWRS